MKETVLELKDVTFYAPFAEEIRELVSGFSLEISKGEVRTIKTSGVEETHILYLIAAGEEDPTVGAVRRPGGSIGKIRRGAAAFSELLVYENIALAFGGRYRKGTAREYGFDPRTKTSELSGADRKRLMFLQRYLQDPVYIAAEEPFEGLDEDERRQVMSFIVEMTEKTGIPVLIIETIGTEDRR